MKATRKQITARVFKKLSALRATLSDEERIVLDGLIGAQEVQAHRMKAQAATRAVSKTPKASRAVEVEAHRMKVQAATRAVSKTARASKVAEVEAHRMKVQAATRAVSKTARASKVAEVQAHKLAARKATPKKQAQAAGRLATNMDAGSTSDQNAADQQA